MNDTSKSCNSAPPRKQLGLICRGDLTYHLSRAGLGLLSRFKTSTHLSLVVRKPAFCIWENKDSDQLTQISFPVTAKLISASKLISTFVFATRIVRSLFYLNPQFQASSHLVWLYSLVCVGPGPLPRRLVFSE